MVFCDGILSISFCVDIVFRVLGCVPRSSGLAGLWYLCVKSLRSYQVVFQSGGTILHSHQQWTKVPISPRSRVIFLIIAILLAPDGSDDKESACNVGDPGSIAWRRKWQPTPGKNSMDRGAWWVIVQRVAKVGHD